MLTQIDTPVIKFEESKADLEDIFLKLTDDDISQNEKSDKDNNESSDTEEPDLNKNTTKDGGKD